MTTYISMLRGINVSGQKKINMQELKALYEGLNLGNVRTYIQSGNVVLEAEETGASDLSIIIEQKLFENYGFAVPVIIRSVADIQAVIADNPFLQRENIETDKLYITFLWNEASPENAAKLQAINYTPDECIIDNRAVYILCPSGYGRTKLTNTFIENKLKTIATTRNWQTINELLKLACKA
jgi:uncharacterized protein (DUF1697 family)